MRHCRNDHRPTQREGLSEEAARQKVLMVDRFGLLTDKMPNLLPFQTKLVQKRENLSDWDTDSDVPSLLDVVRNVKPDILIGVLRTDRTVYGRDHP